MNIALFVSLFFLFSTIYILTNHLIVNQRKKHIEFIKNLNIDVKDESQINAELEELNQLFAKEDHAYMLFIFRYVFLIFWLLFVINFGMPLTSDYWDALSANPTLGRTFLILMILSLVCIAIAFALDLYQLFKFFSLKQMLSDDNPDLFRFTLFSQRLKQMKFRRFFFLFFCINSVLLFISSQVLLWGFIVL